MKTRLDSFSGRLTRTVVFTVLVTMTIISVFVFLVAASGILMFSKAHYSDILEKANRDLALTMSKVEVSADNIIDELCWHLTTPELVLSTMEYELNVNRHVYGCGIGFVEDFYPAVGRWYEPYALNEGGKITLKIIGSEAHDYFQAEWYTKGLASPEGVWSTPYLDEEGGETVLCTFSRRVVMEPEKEIAGVFGADLSISGLASLIQESIRKENEESIFSFRGRMPRNNGSTASSSDRTETISRIRTRAGFSRPTSMTSPSARMPTTTGSWAMRCGRERPGICLSWSMESSPMSITRRCSIPAGPWESSSRPNAC